MQYRHEFLKSTATKGAIIKNAGLKTSVVFLSALLYTQNSELNLRWRTGASEGDEAPLGNRWHRHQRPSHAVAIDERNMVAHGADYRRSVVCLDMGLQGFRIGKLDSSFHPGGLYVLYPRMTAGHAGTASVLASGSIRLGPRHVISVSRGTGSGLPPSVILYSKRRMKLSVAGPVQVVVLLIRGRLGALRRKGAVLHLQPPVCLPTAKSFR